MRRETGFTLVEIMIVVAVIALLAAIAAPSFMRARKRAQNAKFINALRIGSDAADLYAIENEGRYPPDVNRGVVPPELASYLDPTFDWTAPTPIGGRWDWEFGVHSVTAAISVVLDGTPDVGRMTEIDRQYDDGDLTTGRFRQFGADRYAVIIQP
jgi:prepilin-type N-terminal cleavage/methylation domain-containing protein